MGSLIGMQMVARALDDAQMVINRVMTSVKEGTGMVSHLGGGLSAMRAFMHWPAA